MTFHLISKNSMGYESAYCGPSHGWVGRQFCKLPGQRTLYRSPTIKTWTTEAGVRRWMAERPNFQAEIVAG